MCEVSRLWVLWQSSARCWDIFSRSLRSWPFAFSIQFRTSVCGEASGAAAIERIQSANAGTSITINRSIFVRGDSSSFLAPPQIHHDMIGELQFSTAGSIALAPCGH